MLDVALSKRRAGFTVAAEFALAAGGALALFGATGAGKSTVLHCIAGIEPPDTGRIVMDGETWFPPPLPLYRRRLGYLAQRADLFPHLSVAANVTFGLPRRESRAALSPWLTELRRRLGLEACWDAPARGLSGGEARRVALARMLARRPPLVLLDEPFSGLDRATVRDLVAALNAWRDEIGFALLVVDHQAEVLEALTSEVIFLQRGQASPPETWASLRRRADPAAQELLPVGLAPEMTGSRPTGGVGRSPS
ncbi:MAG: ATP-binding cassette domain-containing protein [Terriglobales bacterium]